MICLPQPCPPPSYEVPADRSDGRIEVVGDVTPKSDGQAVDPKRLLIIIRPEG
jgi:hypothetical protein